MPGYFIIQFQQYEKAERSVQNVINLTSIDGYKGMVRIEFSISSGTGSVTSSTPLFLSLDEDEMETADVTVGGGTMGTQSTLRAIATNNDGTDMDSIAINWP